MLELKNVTKIYGEGASRVIALNSIDMCVEDADFVAITGPSGSGKSTLLNVIGGLDDISGGEVNLDSIRIDNLSEEHLVDIRRRKIAYVFQQYHLIPSLTALENVLLPMIFCGSRRDGQDKARQMLEKVGLSQRGGHKPGQLSGGEQQRVAIARALVNNCSMILADEPTGNLDQKTGIEILGLFDELNKDGYTIIMVTHSLDIAGHARRNIQLQDGQIMGDFDIEKE
ncbi:MAG: ABC transporter ATP-binding protein [Chloroflexota bacterium]|nr:ABC transporter ATP-binding protein [Chloroflexota bacterium]